MNSLQADDLIRSVVSITRERDRNALEEGLLEAIQQLLNAEAVGLSHSCKSSDGHTVEEVVSLGSSRPEAFPTTLCNSCDTGTEACITNHHGHCTHTLPDGNMGVVMPLQMPAEQFGIITLISQPLNEEERRLLTGMLRVYENFLAIFHDSQTDTLTGLLNRKTFDQRMAQITSPLASPAAPRYTTTVHHDRREQDEAASHWLGVLDIDHFKRINDTYGHLYGDEVLLLLARLMRESFRKHDLLFRDGGEEFVVVLAPTSEANAQRVFERFRTTIEQFSFPQIGSVTLSIGVCPVKENDQVSQMFGRADQALYYAKSNGRNQVCLYEQLLAAGSITPENEGGSDITLF